eukprot:2437349-Rhodomonas_salina.1
MLFWSALVPAVKKLELTDGRGVVVSDPSGALSEASMNYLFVSAVHCKSLLARTEDGSIFLFPSPLSLSPNLPPLLPLSRSLSLIIGHGAAWVWQDYPDKKHAIGPRHEESADIWIHHRRSMCRRPFVSEVHARGLIAPISSFWFCRVFSSPSPRVIETVLDRFLGKEVHA